MSDLPNQVRLTFLARRAETMGLPMGTHDDAAHLALAAKPVTIQNTAYVRAETMMFIARHERGCLKWGQIAGLLKAEAAKSDIAILAPSYATKRRWDALIAGVDTVNWAPALAPKYQGCTAMAELSPEAWAEFETLLGLAGKNGTGWPLKEAWRRIEDQKAARGWIWPDYRTVMRRWDALDEVRKRVLRMGVDEAAKSLIQYQPRTVEGLFAMQQVELDGREFKVKVRFRDGKIGCPWVIVYTDRASSRIVGYAVSDSENEEASVEATNMMCDENGIPDLVYTDNGSAFNGKRMAGGLNPLIRRKETRLSDWEVPGVLKLYGIGLQNAGPRKARSKLSERRCCIRPFRAGFTRRIHGFNGLS
ncbi:MAG: transposase domain-containing protein [Paracoccus sp. (in: a-proteobacteria)]